VDGNGLDDFLIGSQYDSEAAEGTCQTVLLLGDEIRWSPDTSLSIASASFLGEVDLDYSGKSVALADDVNGDGQDDLLIAAPHNEGRVLDEGGAGERGGGEPSGGDAGIAANCRPYSRMIVVFAAMQVGLRGTRTRRFAFLRSTGGASQFRRAPPRLASNLRSAQETPRSASDSSSVFRCRRCGHGDSLSTANSPDDLIGVPGHFCQEICSFFNSKAPDTSRSPCP